MIKKVDIFLIVSYLLTRLINITQLPIFNDEAFFLYAGRQILNNPVKNLFFNFSDGKEPLFFWVYSLANLFPDQLLALRLLSVFFGLLTFIYFRKITKNIYASLLFLASPFLLFYQRIGMQETMLTFFLVAATYYALKNKYVTAGTFSGLALITKTTTLVYLLPLFIVKFNPRTVLVTLSIYLPFFFGFQNVVGHNSAYAGFITPQQMIINIKSAARWLWEYQGPLGLLGILTPPVILESLIAKIFFPRYFLFIIPVLLIIAAKFINRYVLLLLLIPNIILSFQIITDVKSANLPYIEKWQYLEAWPAGYGIKETAAYLKLQNIKSVTTEDIMITKYGLLYYYPELNTSNTGSDIYVFKKSKELADELGLIKLYNTYDVSVYRSYSGSQ